MGRQARGRASDLTYAHPRIVLICILIHILPSPPLFVPYRIKADITESDVTNEGQTALYTLPTDELVLNKEYKITYKVRIGRGVESGITVDIPVALAGPGFGFDRTLEVLVK